MDNNEDSKQMSKKIKFTEVDQCESDMALAAALQQQEREFMSLMMSESDYDDNDDDDDDDGSFFSSDDSSNDDDASEFVDSNTAYVSLEELEEEGGSNYEDMEEDDVDPDELSYEELIALGDTVGAESKGLPANEITNYLHPYSYKHQVNCNDSLDQCVICQFEYEEEEAIVALGCQHAYHSDCITKWLQLNKVCPICNKEVSLVNPVPDTTQKSI